jgi:hypothetical protein
MGDLTLEQLHELAVTEWHSSRPGSDARFIACIDEIERRLTPEEYRQFRAAFPTTPTPAEGGA